jgi:hypothetical protein
MYSRVSGSKSLDSAATNKPFLSVSYERRVWDIGGITSGGGKQKRYEMKPVPVKLCSPQIPYRLS